MLYDTINDACHAWVHEMHHIPMSVIDKLSQADPSDFPEVTPPTKYDNVYITDGEHNGESGEIIETNYENNERMYLIKLDNDETVPLKECDFEVTTAHEGYFPIWGTMFAFSDGIDNDWLEGMFGTNGFQIMADCGFRIYESEDYTYVFGIDGAGYEFYPEHWIPLYKARGLKWHKEET